jgi:hypothetical protein
MAHVDDADQAKNDSQSGRGKGKDEGDQNRVDCYADNV